MKKGFVLISTLALIVILSFIILVLSRTIYSDGTSSRTIGSGSGSRKIYSDGTSERTIGTGIGQRTINPSTRTSCRKVGTRTICTKY